MYLARLFASGLQNDGTDHHSNAGDGRDQFRDVLKVGNRVRVRDMVRARVRVIGYLAHILLMYPAHSAHSFTPPRALV